MLQSTVIVRRTLARARRPAIVAGASPSSSCLPEALLLQGHRRFLMSSSAPPPNPQQEQGGQSTAAGAGGKPAEPVSEKEAARLKKIAKIKEEIRRGYFYELGEMNRTKGKVCGCVFGRLCVCPVVGLVLVWFGMITVAWECCPNRSASHPDTQLFEADKELLPLDQARRFPPFEAESLLGVTHQFQTLLTQAPNQVGAWIRPHAFLA